MLFNSGSPEAALVILLTVGDMHDEGHGEHQEAEQRKLHGASCVKS